VTATHLSDEEVFRAEFALRRGEQFFLRGLLTFGMAECLFWSAAREQIIDQRPCRDAVEIGDCIAQHLDQAVFLRRQHGGSALMIATDLALVTPGRRRAPRRPAIRHRRCRCGVRAPA
jgi:hypothetical protein